MGFRKLAWAFVGDRVRSPEYGEGAVIANSRHFGNLFIQFDNGKSGCFYEPSFVNPDKDEFLGFPPLEGRISLI